MNKNKMALSCSQAKNWVKENYEIHDDGVVAKSQMYMHYEDDCKAKGRTNMETSIFGRVVKAVFPDVNIRRLGGRDNLKYYYCGIRAKETSAFAIDNTTTTRPKRRLRKRELVTNKMEVNNCLRWLNANYMLSNDHSVVKTDVYEQYVNYCHQLSRDPVSIQYFGMVVTHAFPNITKRKLGPRTCQQKFYFGIKARPDPLCPETVHAEMFNLDTVISNKAAYRENIHESMQEDDEFSCRSPASDTSEPTLPHPISYESLHTNPVYHPHIIHTYLPEDTTGPVDYSLRSLRLKNETPEEEIEAKYDCSESSLNTETRTPERPSSTAAMSYCSDIQNSPPRDLKSKPYKPRFHYDYNELSSWTEKDDFSPQYISSDSKQVTADSILKKWICSTFEKHEGSRINREQVYESYLKNSDLMNCDALPLAHIDKTVMDIFPGVATNIHFAAGKTYYEGIRIVSQSRLQNFIEEQFSVEDVVWEEDPSHIERISPPGPFPLEEEYNNNPYNPNIDSSPNTSEVLRDGKYFLRNWLKDNFEGVSDQCVLKAEAYKHYESYARSINQTPFEMNVFGKIVWQVFPNVSVRRLGGRSKPQYHYCGITVKSTSPLFNIMSGKDPAQRSRKKEIATDNRSAEIVIDWLRQNYEICEDKYMHKSSVYKAYNEYCHALNEQPVTLNYFGKLVKHCFPNTEARKIGGRSESTWYYFGLIPKKSIHGSTYHIYDRTKNMPHLIDPSTLVEREPSPNLTPFPLSPEALSYITTQASHSYGSSPIYDTRIPINKSASVPIPPRGYDISLGSHSPIDGYLRQSHRGSPFDTAETLFPRGSPENDLKIFYAKSSPKRIHFGGQVVPSQTPPNLSIAHVAEILQERNRQIQISAQEDYVMSEYNED